MTDHTGKMIGRYAILAKIGEGGMAVVYRARDERLKREVALKLIRPEMFPQVIIHNLLERFEREAQALAHLDHPNIVHVYDFGEHENAPYLVMEFLPGGTLKQHLGSPQPFDRAAAFLAPVARALEYAHCENIIHRDVKPANILFNSRGVPKLGDFGIAKLLGMNEGQTLTGTGMGMGTPAYMAPEQWAGKTSPAVDIYALGVVYFELVSGKPPYQADSPAEIFAQVLMSPVPDISEQFPGLPPAVSDLLQAAMAKQPADRFADMAAMAEALENLAPAHPLTRPAPAVEPRPGPPAQATAPMTPPSPPSPVSPFPPTPVTRPPAAGTPPESLRTLPQTPPTGGTPAPSFSTLPIPPPADSGATLVPPRYSPSTPPSTPLPAAPPPVSGAPISRPAPVYKPEPDKLVIEPRAPIPAPRRAIPGWAWLTGLAGAAALLIFGLSRLLPGMIAGPTQAPAAEAEPTQAPAAQPEPTSAPQAAPTEELVATEEIAAAFHAPDPSTLSVALDYEPSTLDPALAYDYATWEVIMNVYDRLVGFDRTDPTLFTLPLTEWFDLSADGKTFIFRIRDGVRFHNGADLTASDVAYSLRRALLQGGGNSPMFLLSEALFGPGLGDVSLLVDPEYGAYDNRAALQAANVTTLRQACQRVFDAVRVDYSANTVTFTLPQPYAPFLDVLAGPWASVMDEDWAVENGAWDGSCDTWQNWYSTVDVGSPLDRTLNGTGPFMFTEWTAGQGILLERFTDTWRTIPIGEGAVTGPAALERVWITFLPDAPTRLAALQAGDVDLVTLGRDEYPQADEMTGEICSYNLDRLDYDPCVPLNDNDLRVYTGAPENLRTYAMFAFELAATLDGAPNPALGSGKLDGAGIPPDFFSNVHIRRAFAYCFNADQYIAEALRGSGVSLPGFFLPGMPGYEPDGLQFTYDPARCAEEFQAANLATSSGASLWDTGFRMQIAFRETSERHMLALQNLAANVSAVNSKFQIELVGMPSADYSDRRRASALPILFFSWMEDIHDPDNYVSILRMSYFDTLRIPAGLMEQYRNIGDEGVAVFTAEERQPIYAHLNQQLFNDALFFGLPVATNRVYARRWVDGYTTNLGRYGTNYYLISKR